MSRHDVVLRNEGKESAPAERVARVTGGHAQRLQAHAHVDVLCAAVALVLAALRVAGGDALLHESLQRLSTEHVSGAAAHVALFDVRLKLAAKVNGRGGVVRGEKVAEVLQHHIGVIVRLHEPVGVLQVLVVGVVETAHRFRPQVVAALVHVQLDGRQGGIRLGAHEDQHIAPLAPGGLHVAGLALM